MIRKRLIASLVFICMIATMLPIPVAGAVDNDLVLDNGIDASGTGWSWDGDNRVLTMYGLSHNSLYEDSIVLPDQSTIVLKGSNYWAKDIEAGDVTIIGSGELNALSIRSTGDITIESGYYFINDEISADNINIKGGVIRVPGNYADKITGENCFISGGSVYVTGRINLTGDLRLTGGYLYVNSSEQGAIICQNFSNNGGVVNAFSADGTASVASTTSSFVNGVTVAYSAGYLQSAAITGTIILANDQKVFDYGQNDAISVAENNGMLTDSTNHVVIADQAYFYSYFEPVTVTDATLENVFIQGENLWKPDSNAVIPAGTACFLESTTEISQDLNVMGTFAADNSFACNDLSVSGSGTMAMSAPLNVNGNINVSGGNFVAEVISATVGMSITAESLTQTGGNTTIYESGLELTGTSSSNISAGTFTVDVLASDDFNESNIFAVKNAEVLSISAPADVSFVGGLDALAYQGSEIQIEDCSLSGMVYRGSQLGTVSYSSPTSGYQTETGEAVAVLYIGSWNQTSETNVRVEEVNTTTTISDTITEPDATALTAVIGKAGVAGVDNALSNAAINQIIQEADVNTANASSVTVQIQVNLIVTAADLNAGTISFEVVPTAVVEVGGVSSPSVPIDNSYLNGREITVSLPIPSEFEPKEIIHISNRHPIEQYLLEDNDFTISDGVAKLHITHFSELRMNETETVAAKIRGRETGYFSLQAAVDATNTSGDTIDLYKNCDDTVIQIANKSLTIDCNTYKFNNDVVWQLTGCTKTDSTDDEGHPIIIIIRTSGSSSSSSGGGSSSSGNLVSVSQNNHGTISVSPSRAQTGDTVTVTIAPDEGYVLDELIVTDRNGNRVAVTRVNDNEYTFTKPSGLVKVEATFTEDTGEEQPSTSRIPFTDVATTAWYYDAVQYMYESGMMNGTSANTFSPNATTTRAMIVTMLHRLEGEPNASSASFTDVASSMYYADAVAWAQANGVVNGTSATTFSPDQAITREQMATILYRYAQFKGYDVTASNSLNAYTDASQISPYAATAMQWANAEGLITGNTATTINPTGNATRAEVATILMRFAENIA